MLVCLLLFALALFLALALPTAPAMAQGEATVDYYTIKYDENGQKSWDVTFDSESWDEAMAVAVDSEGNVIVTGRSRNGGKFDYYTIKYDSQGNELWSRTCDRGDDDEANAVAVDSEGNVIVTGRSKYGEDFDYYTIKYDKDGTLQWSKSFNGGGDDQAMAVAVDSEGNVIVTGRSQAGHVYHMANETVGIGNGIETNYTLPHHPVINGTERIYLNDNLTTNYTIDNAAGKITFHTPPGALVNITADYDYEASNYDYCTIKYDPDGSELWAEPVVYDAGDADCANGVAVDKEDNIVVTGYSSDGTTMNYCTIKYNGTDASAVWAEPAIYDSQSAGHTAHGHDQAQAIAVDEDDNIIVTGSSKDFGDETKWYLCTIKYHPNGTQFWAQPATYNGSYKGEPWHTIAQGVAADSAGDVIITGCYYVPAYWELKEGNYVYHMAEYNCYITIKYSGTDGSMLPGWPVVYDSGIYDCAHGVAVDSEDNIIVTGASQRSPEADVGGGGGLSTAAIAGIAVGATVGTGALAFLISRGRGKGQPAPRAERRRDARKAAKKRRKSKR